MAMNLHYPGDVTRKQPNQSGVPRNHASLYTVRYRTSVNPVGFCSNLELIPCYICVEIIRPISHPDLLVWLHWSSYMRMRRSCNPAGDTQAGTLARLGGPQCLHASTTTLGTDPRVRGLYR